MYGSEGNLNKYDVNVPGQKLAFITGTKGSAIDSLTFYFI